jgi:hypothetical protein
LRQHKGGTLRASRRAQLRFVRGVRNSLAVLWLGALAACGPSPGQQDVPRESISAGEEVAPVPTHSAVNVDEEIIPSVVPGEPEPLQLPTLSPDAINPDASSDIRREEDG